MPAQTLSVFEALADCKFLKRILQQFVMVGGTALAIHLKHRMSEDLDFFKKGYDLNKREISRFLEKNGIHYKIISEPSREQIDIDIKGVKITFFASGLDSLRDEKNIRYKNLEIASLELIAAMKVSTLSFRAAFRDYYDLYVLNKEVFSIRELYTIAREKLSIGAFKLFCQQLIYTKDIEEEDIKQHLLPRYTISLDGIRAHFEEEIKKELEKIAKAQL
jgi:predicted nucleotidyltransferase component of viral defense system